MHQGRLCWCPSILCIALVLTHSLLAGIEFEVEYDSNQFSISSDAKNVFLMVD